jgi:hypothetical protein
MLDDDIALQIVKEIMPRVGRVTYGNGMECKQDLAIKSDIVLSEVIKQYVAEKECGWTGKRYQPKVLLEALMKLDYGVDIKAIKSE